MFLDIELNKSRKMFVIADEFKVNCLIFFEKKISFVYISLLLL